MKTRVFVDEMIRRASVVQSSQRDSIKNFSCNQLKKSLQTI